MLLLLRYSCFDVARSTKLATHQRLSACHTNVCSFATSVACVTGSVELQLNMALSVCLSVL